MCNYATSTSSKLIWTLHGELSSPLSLMCAVVPKFCHSQPVKKLLEITAKPPYYKCLLDVKTKIIVCE